jgi:hypothetical protein
MGASTLGNFAIGSQAAAGVLGVFGALQQGQADASASNYQAQVARNNAAFADVQAAEIERRAEINARIAIERGQQLQVEKAIEYRKLIGRQVVTLAANGIDVGDGSAVEIIRDTGALAALDQETIRVNAERDAIAIETGAMDQVMALNQQSRNYESEAALLRSRAAHSTQAGFINAGAALITTAGNVGKTAFDFQQQGVDTLLS